MAGYSDLFTPTTPKDVLLRPLTGGVRRDLTTSGLATGEFLDVRNALARSVGLQRRPGQVVYSGGATVTYPPILGMEGIWKDDGTQTTAILDQRALYYLSLSAMTLVKWIYNTGTVTATTVSGRTYLTGSGTLWVTGVVVDSGLSTEYTVYPEISVGDVVAYDLAGTPKYGIIDQIVDDTHLYLTTVAGTASAGATYEIRRAILADSQHYPDLLSVKGKLLIADGNRDLRAYDPASSATTYGHYFDNELTSELTTYSNTCHPHCVAFFKDRLFVGWLTNDDGSEVRNRIRWTTTLDLLNLPALQFVDIPYQAGFLRRLLPLGDTLIAYFNDAIWIGSQTNLYDALPVTWGRRVETGGIGLVGDRAIVSFMGGHFFVGDDNIYYLAEGATSPEAIGDKIRDDYFTDEEALWSCQAVVDPQRTRLLFSFPSTTGTFSKVASFDYRTKGWTYTEEEGTLLSRQQVTRAYTYDAWLTAPPYTYDTGLGVFPTYDSIGSPDTSRVYIASDGALRYLGDAIITQDVGADPITVTIESGDFDYGEADEERRHLRLSLKFKEPISQDVTFLLYVSIDRGTTWRNVTATGRPLTIPAGDDENYVNFRAVGSNFRFRLVSSSICGQYVIQEIVLRVSGAGVEGHLPANR